jgi:glycosyltransferase involved in cell wall biosynthesis
VTFPSLSIVTPTLNAERYLEQCLASVRSQKIDGLEHLVVDGGSTDGTEQIVAALGASWLPRPGLTQTAAINAGLRIVSGEILAWLNADDLYMPGSLAFVAESFRANPAVDVVYGDCDVIDANGKLLWRVEPGPYRFHRLLRRGNTIAQPAVFLRREVFERVGYLDESLEFGMDYDLWLRLCTERVMYVPRVLAAFRWHRASKTAQNSRRSWHEAMAIVRNHGGDWTPYLAWSFARARMTDARRRIGQRALGR